jgi:single stranded DNA-binding protein
LEVSLDAVAAVVLDNHTSIVGNLADPNSASPKPGSPVANLRVAITSRVQDRDGTWRDGETSFHKVNVWRDQANNVTDSLAEGDRVMVTGRLRQRVQSGPTARWRTDRSWTRSSRGLGAARMPILRVLGVGLRWCAAAEAAQRYAGRWQTASTLLLSGSKTKAP